MKVRELSVGLERTERHAKYFMSKPVVRLSVSLEPDDDLREVFEEISGDVREMVAEMILEEEKLHEKKYRKN